MARDEEEKREEREDSDDDDVDSALASKVAASSSMKERNMQKAPRHGKTYTACENLMVAKAFIAASVDPERGAKQKGDDFQKLIGEKYNALKKEQEQFDANQRASNVHVGLVSQGKKQRPVVIAYPDRTGSSVFQQFTKKISPAVIKWMSILRLTADGEPEYKSGKDYEKYIECMQKLYNDKFGGPLSSNIAGSFFVMNPSSLIGNATSSKRKSRKSSGQQVIRKRGKKRSRMRSLTK
jgi:hypothetical protein